MFYSKKLVQLSMSSSWYSRDMHNCLWEIQLRREASFSREVNWRRRGQSGVLSTFFYSWLKWVDNMLWTSSTWSYDYISVNTLYMSVCNICHGQSRFHFCLRQSYESVSQSVSYPPSSLWLFKSVLENITSLKTNFGSKLQEYTDRLVSWFFICPTLPLLFPLPTFSLFHF